MKRNKLTTQNGWKCQFAFNRTVKGVSLQEKENCTGTKIVPLGLSLLLMARRVSTKKHWRQRHICSVECCGCLYDNVLFILVQINRNLFSKQMEIGSEKRKSIWSWCHWALGKINLSFVVNSFIVRIFINCNTVFAAMSWGNSRRNSFCATANAQLQIVQTRSIQSTNNNI